MRQLAVRPKRPRPGKAHRDGDDLRAPAGSRGPCGPRPLGGRPYDGKPPSQGDRDPGRALRPATASSSPARGNRGRAGLRKRCEGASPPCPPSCGVRSPGTRDTEMAEHRRFSVETGVEVYFCDPRSPWQRGSNENTNGLLRQYFPKGESLEGVTQGAPRRGCGEAQRPAAKDARLSDPGREAHRADRGARDDRRRALTSLRPTAFARQRSD